MRLGDLDALKKEFIKEFYTALGQGNDSFDVIGTMAKVIDNAPTVIVDNCGKCPYYGDDDRNIITEAFNDGYNTAKEKFERPKGNWKGRRYYRPSTNQYDCEMSLCSECGEEYSYDAETGISITDYSFCPNCGALMKKGGAE